MPHIYLTQSILDNIHSDYKSETHILKLHNGTTQSIPYSLVGQKKTLTCSICWTQTKWRQWYNRDKWYGICQSCLKEVHAKWLSNGDNMQELLEELRQNYGIYWVHYGKLEDFILQS